MTHDGSTEQASRDGAGTVVALAADHAGWELKDFLADRLRVSGYEVVDLGTDGPGSVDYPDYGAAVGTAVATRRADFGVAVCGSGIGIAMAAGKIVGIRAATVHDAVSARLAREHNDANVICLGARLLTQRQALDALDAYLAADFAAGRHLGRVRKIDALAHGAPDLDAVRLAAAHPDAGSLKARSLHADLSSSGSAGP